MAPHWPPKSRAPAEVSKAKSESLLQRHFLVSSVHPGALGNCQWVSHIVTVKTRGVINQGLALYDINMYIYIYTCVCVFILRWRWLLNDQQKE